MTLLTMQIIGVSLVILALSLTLWQMHKNT